jgi:TatD DNase family protein
MDLKFFDAHCHLQLPQFDADRATIISHLLKNGLGAIVVGVDFTTSREAVELAEQYDFLWAAIGLHPHDNVAEEFDMASYRELASDPKVVAIGECGLDYFRSGETEEERDAQKRRFENQIALAVKVGKPLIIHCRDAHDDMLAILKEHVGKHPELKVIIHFFTGTGELAKQYLDLGCYLSFPGPITYTDMYDESIRVAPLDKILSETDSPFAAPVPFRGKRNEPVYVEEVVKKIAAIKGVSVDDMAAQILENAKKVFAL